MSQTLRVFIAAELPVAVNSVLESVQQELKSLRLKARWVKPENIHLTLKFLGNINPVDVDIINGALVEAAGNYAPFALTLGGIGFFPGIKRPRVVWAGLGGDIRMLLNLQRDLEDRLDTAGFPKEKRAYKAHLTLGRIRDAVQPKTVGQAVQKFSDLGGQKFTVDRITLFRSDLKPTGAVYSRLKQVGLSGLNNEY